DIAAPPLPRRGCVIQLVYPAITLVAPVGAGLAAELAPELVVSGDRPRVEESEAGLEVTVCDIEGARDRLDAVVERDALLPDRVPHPLRDLVDVASIAMHEYHVEIAARCELGPAVSPDGYQGDTGLVAEQL